MGAEEQARRGSRALDLMLTRAPAPVLGGWVWASERLVPQEGHAGPSPQHQVLCAPGADFTNTFCLLSSFLVGLEAPGLDDILTALTTQCASLEELRLAFRPQMDPRWVCGSCFFGMFVETQDGQDSMGACAHQGTWDSFLGT